MSNDFKDHPKSITEIKALKSHSGADWTPRDALIAALRDMDSGDLKPKTLIICCDNGEPIDDKITTRYYNSSPTRVETIGILEIIKFNFMEDTNG